MASYVMNYKIPTGSFQRPVQQNESHIPHSKPTSESAPTPAPFFLQRPSIAAELASRLIPIDVDLHTKKNMEEHSTHHYDISGLVLRRGQSFSFTVTFNRDFNPDEHQLYVRLAIGPRSMISKRTQIRLLVDGTPSGNGWSARTIPIDAEEDPKKNNRLSFRIDSPSDAIIGKYALLLEVRPIKTENKDLFNKQDLNLFLFEIDVYFLFNPWKQEDACALSSSEQIAEYVLNEHGQIYLGSSEKPQATPWYFGQFERAALLTALTILDHAQLPAQNRIDPSLILRILASKICSNPGMNNGIFPSLFNTHMGSSQNNAYTSSSAILKQYLLSNGRSVQGGSGSNWQHAAVLCSLSRSLGIPCRIVTVYNAACRADTTENNDIHWDTKQRPLKQLNSDIICSAHVWNECWMRRNDLPNNEQDWQIIDSTPVHMCDGIRRTGPCAVSSLKKGDLGLRWDTPFIHSSIHGNKNHWIVYPDGNMELLDVQENQIGTKIITRSLTNEFEPEDITKHYKNSMKSTDDKGRFAGKLNDDVEIDLKLPEGIQFGDNILFELKAKNKSNETRIITTALTVCISNNPGQRVISCLDQPIQTLNLEPNKEGNLQFKIHSEQYINRGKQDNIILKYYLHSQVQQTNQTFTRDGNLIFNRGDIIKPILDEDVIDIGQPVLLKIQIANTFSRPLQNGRIYIDGLGINQILAVNRSFAPKESIILQTKLYPRRIGVGRLYVTFISADVHSLTQSIPVEIVPEPIKKLDDEPLLKSNTEILTTTTTTTTTTETKTEEKGSTSLENTSDKPDHSANREEEKPSPVIVPEEQPQEKKSAETKPGLPSINIEDEEEVEELYLKKKPTHLQPNTATNLSIPHGSTLSLDKDKMSVDSLDISNDRRHLPTDNNNPH